ncbi:flagellar biosynthesis anti-sigma factor FlgM [Ideonella azotifigens]|uniref:Negative regulator of flagellin synthesis n=1 Tax=Ideonella azotifigens TaxID=513160 RepID=A0ABN1K9S8_9BURK|nr:flagellar biosynthesis anti-sigma factor FlgM [Ideonella azotifigens]MCD2339103.1 flagellar biosynthesis anti-sigma factor FlgM [Ideonella azotifigens]
MRITGRTTLDPLTGTAAPAAAEPVSPAAPVGASAAADTAAPLQSDALAPAMQALDAMPEIDSARVAELRDALARGEIKFDADRLAGLVQRFHNGRG